jgi:hypothetical protein
MRRLFIYPHRSVRAIRITPLKTVMAVVTAAALTWAIAHSMEPLLAAHNRLCVSLLHLGGIPILGVSPADLFSPLPQTPVLLLAAASFQARSLVFWVLFAVALVTMAVLHWRIPLARSFLVFLTTLLLISAAMAVFHPAGQLDSAEFSQIWMRGEVLVWLVLPWFSASVFILTDPSILWGGFWVLLTQTYGFVWSAARLAFGLALMHYSGMLFAPMYWFALGFLADVVYVTVFYSIAVQWAAGRTWGRRA